MTLRSLAPALALLALSAPAFGADDHPYKNVKVGDFATYSMDLKAGGLALKGTTTQTVVAKSDKEVTIKTTSTVNNMPSPAQEVKIDLTKPYDPTSLSNLPPGVDAKVEKGKEGKEKATVMGKEYEFNWSTYKMKASIMGQNIEGDFKVWLSSSVPMGMGKMEMNMAVAGMKVEMKMELTEAGNKK